MNLRLRRNLGWKMDDNENVTNSKSISSISSTKLQNFMRFSVLFYKIMSSGATFSIQLENSKRKSLRHATKLISINYKKFVLLLNILKMKYLK